MNVLPVQSFEHMPTGGENADGTLQLWTHLNASDSMFLALLEKQG
jgi:hypothetical protein